MVRCLNPYARRSRLFWLTHLGTRCKRRLAKEAGKSWTDPQLPDIDYSLLGWLCFSHRAAILKALVLPMIPAGIKRRAHLNDPNLRMSANNVRDAIRLMLAKGIVRAVRINGHRHLQYELAEIGRICRELLLNAERSAA